MLTFRVEGYSPHVHEVRRVSSKSIRDAAQQVTRLGVPDEDAIPVCGAGDDPLSVPREVKIVHLLAVSIEAANLLPRRHIPKLEMAIALWIVRPCQDEATIR